MRNVRRAMLAAPLAALVLAAFVAASDASLFAIPGETFRAAWSSVTFTSAEGSVRCPLTLEGSISASTFENVAGTRVGSASSATLGACTGGTASILRETLPWNVQYSSFAGTLPNVTSLTFKLLSASFRIDPTGSPPACQLTSSESSPISIVTARESRGPLTSARLDETRRIPLRGEFLCEAASGTLAGTGTIHDRGDPEEPIEGEAEVFIQDRASWLVDRTNGTMLVTVNLPTAGASRELEAVNIHTRRRLSIVSIEPTGTNRERFTLQNGMNVCQGLSTVLQRRSLNECKFYILRREECVAGTEARVRIFYRIGVVLMFDEFVIRAT